MTDALLMPVLLTHAFTTLAMVGLIWFVQIVHYPLMARVGEAQFQAYEHAHTARTTWVVAPLMLAELASAAMLVPLMGREAMPLTVSGLLALGLIWGSTFLLQVPAHRRLLGGFDARAHRCLVGTNWVRTVLWSLRGVLSCLLLTMV